MVNAVRWKRSEIQQSYQLDILIGHECELFSSGSLLVAADYAEEDQSVVERWFPPSLKYLKVGSFVTFSTLMEIAAP